MVDVERDGPVARIFLNRPEKANALTSGLLQELKRSLNRYVEAPAVRDPGRLITAAGMAPLDFAREIFAELDLYEEATLEAWYQLFKTGRSEYFARLQHVAAESGAPTMADA